MGFYLKDSEELASFIKHYQYLVSIVFMNCLFSVSDFGFCMAQMVCGACDTHVTLLGY